MTTFANLPIKRKLLIVIVATCSCAVLLTTGLIGAYDAVMFRRSLVDELGQLADIVGNNSTATLAFKNQPAAFEMLSALRAKPSIVAARIYDAKEKVFATYVFS